MSYRIKEMNVYKEDWCSGYCLVLGNVKQPLWFSFEKLMEGYKEKHCYVVDADYGLDKLDEYYEKIFNYDGIKTRDLFDYFFDLRTYSSASVIELEDEIIKNFSEILQVKKILRDFLDTIKHRVETEVCCLE